MFLIISVLLFCVKFGIDFILFWVSKKSRSNVVYF